MAELPPNPSAEHLRKQAKRLAKAEGLKLAAAQHKLAKDYGLANWAELMRAVELHRFSPLTIAAGRSNVDAVRALLAQGAAVDGEPHETETPLFMACLGEGSSEARLAVAELLIEAGAHVQRGCTGGATALHAAAARGPARLVEMLLEAGALHWQATDGNIFPRQWAENDLPEDKERILDLLSERPRIEDDDFREAVAAIQSGDAETLGRLLDARPELLAMRAVDPPARQQGYFANPKLFWFIANNPTLIPRSPDNIVELARLMIARGVAQEDLTYTLGLVTTNMQMPADVQGELIRLLYEAGAQVTLEGMAGILGHRQTDAAARLLDKGWALTAPVAAGLGRTDALAALLARAAQAEKNDALGLAVINHEVEAARLCLAAGADPSAFMPCHTHSTPLHQAALDGRIDLMELLVAHGARLDTPDKLWRGTPLGWAMHNGRKEAEAWLRARL
jgi:ankyrin repeat protein